MVVCVVTHQVFGQTKQLGHTWDEQLGLVWLGQLNYMALSLAMVSVERRTRSQFTNNELDQGIELGQGIELDHSSRSRGGSSLTM